MKFNVYIDGYNLYNGLKETSRREPFYKCCYWLDLWKLGKWLEGLHSGWELQAVKFFTAPEHIEPPPNSWDPKTNQTRYLEALRSRNIEIIKGFFRKQEALCKHASCDIRGQYFDLTEKMTDVALGVEMVSDVLRGEVEGLVLITRDVD